MAAMLVEPARLTNQEMEAAYAAPHELVYNYLEETLAVRCFLQNVWARYVTSQITLRTVYALLHAAGNTIETAGEEFYKEAPQFDINSHDEGLKQSWARGVAGLLHIDYQDQEAKARNAQPVMRRPQQEQMAHIGLAECFCCIGDIRIRKWVKFPV